MVIALLPCISAQCLCICPRPEGKYGVPGLYEVRTWSGARVSVLVCTRGAVFEMDWWWFGFFQ